MVYQALLFSTDEKTSRVVNQILGELEFHVEICAEPFAAVKQITSQHYDALVVDCDNEQNATLLFKSARNSNSNGGSLAVALVQGQSGISKAFRIGANLVLTKPIHVEQSKGTLRTAKGLLRKAEAAKANSASTAPKADKSAPSFQASGSLIATAGSTTGTIGMALESQPEKYPELGPAEAALLESMPATAPLLLAASAGESQASAASGSTRSSEQQAIQGSAGSAAAAAPARAETAAASSSRDESAVKELGDSSGKEKDKKKAAQSPSSRRETFAKSTPEKGDPLTFAGGELLGAQQVEPAGNKRNFLIATVLVLAAAGAVYYGWPQLQPLLANVPIVQKYFPSKPAPAQPAAPAPAAAPVTGAPTGSSAQPATAGAPGETPAQPNSASVQNSSSAATTNQPATAGKSADSSANPSQDGTAQPLHIPSETSAALLLNKTEPVYPPSALQQRLEGSVSLQVNIGKDGTISHLKILSGKPLLATAAATAVRQWKYKPYQLNGQPAEVQTEVTVDFKLPQP